VMGVLEATGDSKESVAAPVPLTSGAGLEKDQSRVSSRKMRLPSGTGAEILERGPDRGLCVNMPSGCTARFCGSVRDWSAGRTLFKDPQFGGTLPGPPRGGKQWEIC